ncbi:MAG: hypothetical protein JW787_08040 [Sedimentisphaerales bacterium]|nr:hypothetical protein [Sedimentisphaerales bacterium]
MRKRINKHNSRPGAALLVVLFIVMVITILSLGFLSQSDIELACGRNMVLRSRMDYLAESGLEHARGLILNPQDVEDEYYTGASGLQLVDGSDDYYNISVFYDDSDPMDQCNYIIDCNAFELKNGEKIGQSNLRARLRLDPCISFWAGNNTTLLSSVAIHGDVYCGGILNNNGTIDGDVFADTYSGTQSGRRYDISDLSLVWPEITVNGFIGKSGVSYHSGDYTLSEDVSGMLLVNGNLTIQPGLSLSLTAAKNQPALYVTGNLIIGKDATVNIEGLAAVGGRVLIDGDADLNVLGGLFIRNTLFETTSDSAGNNDYAILYNGTEHTEGLYEGSLKFDGIDDKIENYSAAGSLNGLSAITLSLWVKSDVINQDRDIFFTREPTDSDVELGIRYDRDGVLGKGTSGIKASIRTTSGFTQIESSSGVQTAGWQHLALTWQNDVNDSHLKLYIDGVLNVLLYDRGPVYGTVTGISKLLLGCGTKSMYWDGLIDDVRIYSRALNVTEINEVKAGASVSDLILYWDFNESGSNINITASPIKTAVNIFSSDGAVEKWGQASNAFYKSIERR